MTFAAIPAGESVFLDANSLIYHFSNDPKYGAACTQLVKRIEQGQIRGATSAHVLTDVAHRLMTLEAINTLGWPAAGIAIRLRKRRHEIAKLTVYQQAIGRISLLGIQVYPVTQALVENATVLCQTHQLLTGDGLILAVMQANGVTALASNDPDFDAVPGITRYTPV
jgi:predicted nucleic acid-binding protein